MKKTLVLGCSFLHGAYTKKDEKIPGTSWVTSLDNSKFDAFAFSGNGIMTWIEFLNHLIKKDKIKEYDSVIVQHTTEPRVMAHNWNKIKDNTPIYSNNVFDMMLDKRNKQSYMADIIDYSHMYENTDKDYDYFDGCSVNLFSINRHTGYLSKFSKRDKLTILDYHMDIEELFWREQTLQLVSKAFNTHLKVLIEETGLAYIPIFWYGNGDGGNHATDKDFVVIEEANKCLGISKQEWYENTNHIGHNNLEQTEKINPMILEYLKSNKHLTSRFK